MNEEDEEDMHGDEEDRSNEKDLSDKKKALTEIDHEVFEDFDDETYIITSW